MATEYRWYDLVGMLGVALILWSYFLLQARRLTSKGLLYLYLNAVGASLVLLSLWQAFNFSAFVIESFWVAISLYGIARAWRHRRRSARIRQRKLDAMRNAAQREP